MSGVLIDSYSVVANPGDQKEHTFSFRQQEALLMYRPALVCDPGSCLLAQIRTLYVIEVHTGRTLLPRTPFEILWPLATRRTSRSCALPFAVDAIHYGGVAFGFSMNDVEPLFQIEERLVRLDATFDEDRDLLVGYLNPLERWARGGKQGSPPGWPINITIVMLPLSDPANNR